MPLNCIPYTTNVEALKEKVTAMKNKLWVDVGLLGGIIPNNMSDIIPLIDAGVVGFKCFLCDSGIPEFPPVNQKEVLDAMTEIRKHDHPVVFMFHAESQEILEAATKSRPTTLKNRDYASFLYTRPSSAEEKAIQMVIGLANATGVRSHIVHLSSSSCVGLLSEARQVGVPITAETTYHYLYFAEEEIPLGNTLFKCCPPIRNEANRWITTPSPRHSTPSLLLVPSSPPASSLSMSSPPQTSLPIVPSSHCHWHCH
eukprot:TRINITY_DN7309_c0_g1_i1.p1 TRINITY_DN7309_c0_g1~~TRINITY_DN7309_c0_g1_i1.p1  ORF type:complete len:256 (-),score=51.75 TRINITY_DN7309_c0_g1_i1:470-1237(-)